MSGKRSRDKGLRAEREIVKLHEEMGVHAERVPLSGAAGGSFGGDIEIECPEELRGLEHGCRPLRAEVKSRANGEGFKTLEGWLGSNDLLFLRRDRQAPIVVMPWETYRRLMGG